jgi:hypothetical protein
MKKFSIGAVILSNCAIAGFLLWGSIESAHACYLDKASLNQTSTTKHWGSNGSDQINPWAKAGAIGLFSVGGLFSLGILYKGYRAGKQAEIAFGAMTEKFEVAETEDVEQSPGAELITLENNHQHPEAPGGKLDLNRDRDPDSNSVEKEVVLSK